MIEILVGTNRPESRSLEVAHIVETLIKKEGVSCEIMALEDIPLESLDGTQYKENKPSEVSKAIEKLNRSRGILVICPEYNGSMPGALKYFIDHWEYPLTFENRPVAFIGLGGRFGGLRPVEHLQQVFGYRNAYIFPERVFISNVWSCLSNGEITDENVNKLLQSQCSKFCRFIKALEDGKLIPQYD